jgi:hypothetical protein
MRGVKPGIAWIRSHWSEGDIIFVLEIDEDGWVVRQVELKGADRVPIAAAALAEWPDAHTEGIEAIRRYEAKYGRVADQPISEWEAGFPREDIDASEFERVWLEARKALGKGAG